MRKVHGNCNTRKYTTASQRAGISIKDVEGVHAAQSEAKKGPWSKRPFAEVIARVLQLKGYKS